MPSQKKRITVYPDEKLHAKITFIAAQDGRSVSNYVQMLLNREVQKWELEHGLIRIDEI